MSKPSGPSKDWSSTTLKIQCKNQNESILESGIALQNAFRADTSLNSLVEYGVFHFKIKTVNMVCSVNKYKLSLEPAKHFNDRVVKLLHQTEEARERNLENRTRHSNIKSNGVIVSQNYPITDYYRFLHDKNNQSDNNHNLLHGKNNQ